MQEAPLVSVLMTAYNREAYIAEAIESVLSSQYKNFELIIADDGSSDGTVAIARKYAALDSRIIVHLNEKNLGQFGNRNFAASLAKGKYLKYLDSDDKFYPFSIGYCVEMLEANPEADWAILNFDKENEGKVLSQKEALQMHFFEKPFLMIGPDGTCYKRVFFERTGGFIDKYGSAGDVYMNLVSATLGKVLLITKDFFFYRLHDDQARNDDYGYLFHYYNVSKNIQSLLQPFFSGEQLKFIDNKNKRRFLKNIVLYFFKKFNFTKTRYALKQASFGLKEARQGLLH